MAGYLLTEDDVKLLKQMAGAFRKKREVILQYSREADNLPAPDVYVALTPEGGIPALTYSPAGLYEVTGTAGSGTGSDVGTGTADVYPIPGFADCEIYQLSRELTDEPYLSEMAFLDHRVYNCSENAVERSKFIVIFRDKNGIWWASSIQGGSADPSSGRCTGTLRFITSLCFVEDEPATGTGTSGSPGTA